MISASWQPLLALPDDQLRRLIYALANELGAWAGERYPQALDADLGELLRRAFYS